MKLKKTLALGLVTLFSLSLTACGNNGDEQASTKVSTGEKSSEQILRVVEQQEMPTADLSLATDRVSHIALNNVYEGLYRLGKDSKPEPAGAAEKATVSEDGLTYTFKLNEKAKWSDGQPVTAHDYVYGWQRTVDPATASEYAYLYEAVKNGTAVNEGNADKAELGIKALSDYELEITLEKPTPYFDDLVTLPSFFPQRQDIVEKFGTDYAKTSENAVYNGPFVLADYAGPGISTSWTYKKNENYWDAETVQLEEIQTQVIKESSTAYNLYQDGQVDDIILSGELAQQSANDPEFVVQREASTYYMELNQIAEDSPYHNEDLRKAISYSINRQALVETILGDGSVEPKGLVPADMVTDPAGKEDFTEAAGSEIAYNEKKAKEHWAKAQKALNIDSLDMDILSSDADSSKKVVEFIQGAIESTLDGVKVTVTPVPFTVRLDRSNKGEFDTVIGGWSADYADPSSFLDLFKTDVSYNRGHYSNEAFDKAVTEAATTNANAPEKRWDNLVEAEQIIMGDMGVIPLYQKAEAHLRSSRVQDVVVHAAGSTYDYKWAYMTE